MTDAADRFGNRFHQVHSFLKGFPAETLRAAREDLVPDGSDTRRSAELPAVRPDRRCRGLRGWERSWPGMVESGGVFYGCKHTFCSFLSRPHGDGDALDLSLLPVVRWKDSPWDTFFHTAWPSLTTVCKLLTLSLFC